MGNAQPPDRSGPFISKRSYDAIKDEHPLLAKETLGYSTSPAGKRYPALVGLGPMPIPPGSDGIASAVAIDDVGRPWFVVRIAGPGAPGLQFSIDSGHWKWVVEAGGGFAVQHQGDVAEVLTPGQTWQGAATTFVTRIGEWQQQRP
jgi:hypothetical protein